MNYSEARIGIQDGDIIAFTGKRSISRAIRIWTGSTHTHVGVARWLNMPDGKPRLWIIESRERRGVTMRLMSSVGEFDWLALNTNYKFDPNVEQFIWSRIGSGEYDWPAIFRRFIGQDPIRDENFICSEFTGEILRRCRFDINASDMSDPGKIVNWAMRNGAIMQRVSN